mgnify:CR=1 FL=1
MNPEIEEKIYFYTENLQVGYGGKQILNPVRIGIKKGEILTLVGPNGAGKSTILKSVAAQLPPLGGAVYLDGALVVHPGHSELDHTLRLHDALKDARLLQLGTLLHDRLEGLQHFAHSLEEFRLMGIFLLHGGIDVLQVSTFKFHVANPLCMACSPKKWRLPKCVGSIIRRQAPECKRKMKTCSLNP